MSSSPPLEHGASYHVYNRGINRQNLFFEAENYRYFLRLYAQLVFPIADTFAYCLLPNHFHFHVRIKTKKEILASADLTGLKSPSQYFSNMFNAYTRAVNKRYSRTGSLFQRPFGRKPVTSDRYYYNLIIYIHRNPQLHGLVGDFRDWPWSSYDAILTENETRVQRTAVLAWFDGREDFCEAHCSEPDEAMIEHLIADDFV